MKSQPILLCLTALFVGACFVVGCNSKQQDANTSTNQDTLRYSVQISAENKRLAKVSASFRLREPLIMMFTNSTPELPDGQAKFVQDLAVTDENGKPISVTYKGDGDWNVDASTGDLVRITYSVRLDHDKYEWAGGPDEAAYITDDGVYYAGGSLFIVPGNKVENAVIDFAVPDAWRVSTPWQKMPGGKPNQFFAKQVGRDMLRNCVLLGTHTEEHITVGDFELRLAVGQNMGYAKQLLVDAATPLVASYLKMFGAAPRATSYLVVVNKGSMNDGEAFSGSFSILTKDSITKENNAVWAHGLAHELFHLWNGISIVPEKQEEWFKEGCTDYMTIVWLRRLGLIDETMLFKKLENVSRKYLLAGLLHRIMNQNAEKPAPVPSLRQAGENKGANRLLIYGGGALAAFMLDVQMREATGGAKGIDELLQAMHKEFGSNSKKYTMNDINRIASNLAGKDCTPFFKNYIEGTQALTIEPMLEALGLQMASFVEEMYISRKPLQTERERLLFDSVFLRPVAQ